MSDSPPDNPPRVSPSLAVARILLGFAILGALLFVPAGRLDWPRGWLFLGLMVLTMAAIFAAVIRFNRPLLAARLSTPRPALGFDRLFLALAILCTLAFFITAGLDERLGWTAPPAWLIAPGAALHVAGMALMTWTMAVNPFAETVVRIQEDRGHRVITTGPYAVVRHPMYAGYLVAQLGWPLLLGSWWAFVPAAGLAASVIWRTAREDRTLQSDLPGYADYAARTRYRLLPGLW